MEIVVASKNAGKVAEFKAALSSMPVKVISLADFDNIPDAVEDGETFEANAMAKAAHYARYTGKACLADDSGLEVDALQGAPGVLSARYAGPHGEDEANNCKLLKELTNVSAEKRTARFRCALAYYDGKAVKLITDGSCEGTILFAPAGKGGFGYDPLFYIPEIGKTLAEISMSEKNAISHRGKAIRCMVEKLAGYLK